jgi:hypothetical protein
MRSADKVLFSVALILNAGFCISNLIIGNYVFALLNAIFFACVFEGLYGFKNFLNRVKRLF